MRESRQTLELGKARRYKKLIPLGPIAEKPYWDRSARGASGSVGFPRSRLTNTYSVRIRTRSVMRRPTVIVPMTIVTISTKATVSCYRPMRARWNKSPLSGTPCLKRHL